MRGVDSLVGPLSRQHVLYRLVKDLVFSQMPHAGKIMVW